LRLDVVISAINRKKWLPAGCHSVSAK